MTDPTDKAVSSADRYAVAYSSLHEVTRAFLAGERNAKYLRRMHAEIEADLRKSGMPVGYAPSGAQVPPVQTTGHAETTVADEHRETELWQVLDWSLWGNGLADILRFPMADVMVAALSEEQRDQAEACIKAWHERRGPSMAVGEGTALAAERDALRELLGSIWLYVKWHYVTKQLTTEQKNLWADAIDATGEPGTKAERWWLA